MISEIRYAIAAAVLLFAANAYPAEIDCDSDWGAISITGDIVESDVVALQTCLAKSNNKLPQVFLHSLGGDVRAAMSMGRQLRKAQAMAIVGAKGCYSSCIFLLAGAVHRIALPGEVGIHRPYSTTTGRVEYSAAQEDFRKLQSDIESYLREMNMSTKLYEAMIRVPPEEVRLLEEEDLSEYGLNQTDPVYAEVQDSKWAGIIGITKQEYLERKRESDTQCKLTQYPDMKGYSKELQAQAEKEWREKHHDCRFSILYGLSVSEFKKRKKRANELCKDKPEGELIRTCIYQAIATAQ